MTRDQRHSDLTKLIKKGASLRKIEYSLPLRSCLPEFQIVFCKEQKQVSLSGLLGICRNQTFVFNISSENLALSKVIQIFIFTGKKGLTLLPPVTAPKDPKACYSSLSLEIFYKENIVNTTVNCLNWLHMCRSKLKIHEGQISFGQPPGDLFPACCH